MHVQDRVPSILTVDDEELLERIKADDGDAYRVLVQRYLDYAYALALRITRNSASAEDVAQDAMITLWTHRHTWENGRAKFSTWLYRVVVNRCADLRRRAVNHCLDDVPEPMDDQPDAAATIHQREVSALVEEALGTLPDQQRIALTLSYFEHLSNADVAEIMGTTVTAVESLLKRGRIGLRERLQRSKADLTTSLEGV